MYKLKQTRTYRVCTCTVQLSHRDPVVIIMPLQRLPVFKTHSLTIRYGYTMNLQKDTINTTKPHSQCTTQMDAPIL